MIPCLRGTQTRLRFLPAAVQIFGAALVDVIVQWFAADPVIVAKLVFPDDAPKRDDGEPPWKRRRWGKVQCAVWAILYTDDDGIESRGPQKALLE